MTHILQLQTSADEKRLGFWNASPCVLLQLCFCLFDAGFYFCCNMYFYFGFECRKHLAVVCALHLIFFIPHKGAAIRGEIVQNLKADGFCLPALDEWKVAARGGESYRYAGSDKIEEVAWYSGGSGNSTHSVAKKDLISHCPQCEITTKAGCNLFDNVVIEKAHVLAFGSHARVSSLVPVGARLRYSKVKLCTASLPLTTTHWIGFMLPSSARSAVRAKYLR